MLTPSSSAPSTSEQSAFLKAWLRSNWKNVGEEHALVMLQAANLIESLELELFNLVRKQQERRA